jgi:putative ABC transport system permease protein
MIITFPVAFLNVAPNLRMIIEREQDEYHLAHYNIFFADKIHESAEEKISNWAANKLNINPKDVVVESRIHQSSKIQSQGLGRLIANDWIELDLISIDRDAPPYINSLVIDEGVLPRASNEIAVLSSYAHSDGLSIGDSLLLYNNGVQLEYTIIALVKSIEYSSFDLSQTAAAYVSVAGMQRFLGEELDGEHFNSYPVYFKYDISLDELREVFDYLVIMINNDESIDSLIAIFWFVRESSFRKGLLDALELTSEYLFVASFFIFLVSGVIIFVTMNRYVNEQKTTIGALYAFGNSRRALIFSFFFRIFILSLISVIVGLFIAKYLVGILVAQLVDKWGLISVQSDLTSTSIVYTIISSSIVIYGFTFIAVMNLIRLTPYEAMRGKSSELKHGGMFFYMANIIPSRILRGSIKNLTRNRTRSILTVIAFTLAITFSGSLVYTHQSIGHTIDRYYQDRVHFDLEVNTGFISSPQVTIDSLMTLDTNNNGIPDITAIEPYIEYIISFTDQPERLAFLMSFARDTQMFEVTDNTISEGSWFRRNSSDIVISRYVAGTLGVKLGSQFSFTFLGFMVNGTVTGITNELMVSAAIMADINYLSYLANQTILANKLLLKFEEGVNIQDIQDNLNKHDPNVVLALHKDFYKKRFSSLASSQTLIIYMMVTLGLIVGFVSVFTTLLIAIAEREKELGLLHVYGHTKSELIMQIIFEGIIIGILSIIPSLLLSRITAENIWMEIVNESLFEMNSYYPYSISILLVIFGFVSILISVVPSFIFTTSKKLAEIIREE